MNPKITNKRVLNIEVTAVTWSSPIAKKMYLRRKFYRVPRKVTCPQGQLFSKRRFLGFLFFYGYPAVFLTHNVQHASKVYLSLDYSLDISNHCGINSIACYWISSHGINNPLWLSAQLPFLQSYCHLKIYFLTILLMRGPAFLLVSAIFVFFGSVKGMDSL